MGISDRLEDRADRVGKINFVERNGQTLGDLIDQPVKLNLRLVTIRVGMSSVDGFA